MSLLLSGCSVIVFKLATTQCLVRNKFFFLGWLSLPKACCYRAKFWHPETEAVWLIVSRESSTICFIKSRVAPGRVLLRRSALLHATNDRARGKTRIPRTARRLDGSDIMAMRRDQSTDAKFFAPIRH